MRHLKDFFRNFIFQLPRFAFQHYWPKNTHLVLIPVSKRENEVIKQ